MVQYPIDASEGPTLMPRPPTGTLEKHRKSYFFRVRMPDGSRPRIPFGECSEPRAKEKAATSKERRDEMIAKYLKERAAARVRERRRWGTVQSVGGAWTSGKLLKNSVDLTGIEPATSRVRF